ncbi:NADPH:quinone reductase [Hyphodiscus hymeniophilus]|uniref:NADPH:quinone reductase n=1 Tax=Hyphodiscus hymeniophilus TaxID=353542 RepID=A0A9P6VD91_9HELO|nr:NADPH:quinone reductase [Hyphodiscus hymeniophilus]
MRAVRIEKFVKDYDEIEVSEIPKPQTKDGDVLVQVAAAGVNFVDLLYARGKHQNNRALVQPPFTLGLEFAGTVIASGPTSQFAPGDRVFGARLGSYAQFVAVRESSLHSIPLNWSFTHAAGLAATAPVSYGALILRGRLKKGETVLIHAAAGGLGLMAVQIAKGVGARRYGADEVVNYSEGEWWKKVLKMTNAEGAAVVYDIVGLVDKSLKCVKHGGRILIVGFAGTEGSIETIAMNRVLLKQVQIIGYRFGESERRDPAETLEAWKGLEGMIEEGLLKPTVFEKEYKGLERAVTAMKDLATRKVWGKAVVLIEPEKGKPRL